MRPSHCRTVLLGLALLLTPFSPLIAGPLGPSTAAPEETAPGFFLITLDGEYVSLEDLKGKVVLLDFWATWCGPCRESVPHLRHLNRKMKDAPFVIVGLSVDHDQEELLAFVEAEELNWPQYWDKRRELAQLYGVNGYPTYILIDHQGSIVFEFEGWGEGVGPIIEAEVAMAIRKAMKAPQASSPGGR